jgi:hypothetical protein
MGGDTASFAGKSRKNEARKRNVSRDEVQNEPKHVGCPYCVRGHAPTWQYTPEPGEWVHILREKAGDATKVTVVACIGANQQSSGST